MDISSAIFWQSQARRTVWRHNACCVLADFLPFCLGVSAVFACALLVARGNGSVPARPWATAYGLALAACAAGAAWRSHERFFASRDALVRLDWNLGLHNRLSAAAAGGGEFPPVQAGTDGYLFHWRKSGPPLAASARLVGAAATVPVTRPPARYIPASTPAAWTQTAEWIDALKKTDALQEPALEDLRERLEQLRQQPAQDWYSQSSLEAGDNLHEQTAQSIQALQRDLQSALDNLEAMQRFTDQTSALETKSAQANLANALKGLELGNLPLNQEMLGHLKSADLSKLRDLDPKQIEEMKRRLKAGTQVCKACLQPGGWDGKENVVAARAPVPKDAKFARDHESSAPLTYNEKPADLASTGKEAVSNGDLEHALPGDLLGVGKGEHNVNPSKYAGPAAGGAAASNGQGGEAVWRNDLTPKEREVLKNFFK